jgi:hypothetical protein
MTKIKTLVSALLLFVGLSAIGQESDMDDRKLRFGLHGSPNFGWLSTTMNQIDNDKLRPRLGFGYGLMFDYRFSESPNYMLSTGFNLTSMGGGLNVPIDSVVVNEVSPSVTNEVYFTGKRTRTYRLNYLNIPVLLKMRTNEIGYMTYFAAIGFDLGVKTRAFANDKFEWQENGSALTPANQDDINITDQMFLFRTALNITAGAEYNLSGNTNIYVGLGWHNGFLNIFKNKDFNRVLTPDANGFPKIDANTNRAIEDERKNANSNYISLDVGIFF